MATIVLFGVVLCVTSAITAGHQHAQEAQQRIVGAMAAEELLGRIVADGYDAIVITWDNFEESPGTMRYGHGPLMPARFGHIGRRVEVLAAQRTISGTGLQADGLEISVIAFDLDDRDVAVITTFIVEPIGQ